MTYNLYTFGNDRDLNFSPFFRDFRPEMTLNHHETKFLKSPIFSEISSHRGFQKFLNCMLIWNFSSWWRRSPSRSAPSLLSWDWCWRILLFVWISWDYLRYFTLHNYARPSWYRNPRLSSRWHREKSRKFSPIRFDGHEW